MESKCCAVRFNVNYWGAELVPAFRFLKSDANNPFCITGPVDLVFQLIK